MKSRQKVTIVVTIVYLVLGIFLFIKIEDFNQLVLGLSYTKAFFEYPEEIVRYFLLFLVHFIIGIILVFNIFEKRTPPKGTCEIIVDIGLGLVVVSTMIATFWAIQNPIMRIIAVMLAIVGGKVFLDANS